MDIPGVFTTAERKRRKRMNRWSSAALMIGVVAASVFGHFVDWGPIRELVGTEVRVLLAIGFPLLEKAWVRRVVVRRARDFDVYARALGLAATPSDDRVYEGINRHRSVRIWLEDPVTLRGNLSVLVVTYAVYSAWFALGLHYGVKGLGCAVLVAALVSLWRHRRPTITAEYMSKTGLLHRARVHSLEDVEVALATLPGAPTVHPGRSALPSSLDPRDLVARVRVADDDDLLEILTTLADRASADSLGPLVRALRQRRYPLSPRVAGVANKAIVRIRERYGLADEGGLALSSDIDPIGRVGIADETGALSPSEPRDGHD